MADPFLKFIDSFTDELCERMRRLITLSRVHETLSLAYIFVEVAQGRGAANESHLVNLIEFSLKNLIFVSKLYLFEEHNSEFPECQLEAEINQR
jgi:hypothetical protein